MRCGDCRFYREGQGHGQGWCHRHAPAPAVIRYEVYRVEVGGVRVGRGTSDTFWPPVDASDGCGDFEAPVRKEQRALVERLLREVIG